MENVQKCFVPALYSKSIINDVAFESELKVESQISQETIEFDII